MRYGKWFLTLLTALLLALTVLVWSQEPKVEQEEVNTIPLFSVLVPSGLEMEQIHCWEQSPGEFYLFLPGYAALSQVRISLSSGKDILVNGIPLSDGMDCGEFSWDIPYPLTSSDITGTVTFLHSGNVASLYIDVTSGNMEYIHAMKGNEESGKLRLYEADGSLNHGGSIDALSGRGNSTWDQVKKPYNLKLSSQADLLGMGSAKKWALLANYSDRSNLRNQIVFDFAAAAGLAYSPEGRWVDLYLNGIYQGLYQLTERNEIHPQRVDIEKDTGFLVSIEVLWRLVAQEYPHFVLDSNTALRVHHGEGDIALLQQKWQSIENAVLAQDGIDPVTGAHYLDLIDLDSWVRKFLVEEIFGNGDASALSQFFYGDLADGKVFAGPVWDYDVSMGLDKWRMALPNVFYANRPHLRKGFEQNWFHALYQKPEFYDRMVAVYSDELRPLLLSLLENGIQDNAQLLASASKGNQIRWSALDAGAETELIHRYLRGRLEFLDHIWLEGQEYCTATVDLMDGSNAVCFVITPGETIPLFPDYAADDRILGWYDLKTDTPFDPDQPIYEDTVVILKRVKEEVYSESPVTESDSESLPLRTIAPLLMLLGLLPASILLDRHQNKTGYPTEEP